MSIFGHETGYGGLPAHFSAQTMHEHSLRDADRQKTSNAETEAPEIVAGLGDLPPKPYDTEPDHLAAANHLADIAIAAAEGTDAGQGPIIEFDEPFPQVFTD